MYDGPSRYFGIVSEMKGCLDNLYNLSLLALTQLESELNWRSGRNQS